MKKYISLLVLTLFTFVLVNCSKSEEIPTNSNSPYYSTDFGAITNRDFMGQVLDVQGSPIAGVTVMVGTITQTTDVRGFFLIKDAPVKERFAYIKAIKAGYLEGSRSMVPLTQINNLKIILFPDTPTATVTSGVASEVTLPNGAKVLFDGNFKTEAGIAYTGSVKVSVNYLDPTEPATFDKMPGMLLGENKKGSLGVLESFGMINVTLTGSNGEKLQPNTTASLEFPIASVQQTTAPNYIPLWHFDTTKGYWVEEGLATKTGSKYTGTVSHFSWWNCDVSANSVTLKLTVTDCNGKPIENMAAELVPKDKNFGSRIGYTNGTGEVSGVVLDNMMLTLNLYSTVKECETTIVYSQQLQAMNLNSNTLKVVVPCTSTTTALIQGKITNCNDVNVTNGYVCLKFGNQYFNSLVNNGDFAFNIITCNSNTIPISIQGMDLENNKESILTSTSFSGQMVEVGTLKACADLVSGVNDIDGNFYPVVTINNQVWTQKNLEVTHYRNGDEIPQVTDQATWSSLTTGAWCYYENKTENGTTYGKLYNWYAVNDPRGLAPEGYHIPSDAEFTSMSDFLGGLSNAGGKMKSTSIWAAPNTGATNSSGFNAQPGGCRALSFIGVGSYAYYWTSTELPSLLSSSRILSYNSKSLSNPSGTQKLSGNSIRCIKN